MTRQPDAQTERDQPAAADPLAEEVQRLREENDRLRDLLHLSHQASPATYGNAVQFANGDGLPVAPAVMEALVHGRDAVRPPHERYRVLRRIAAGGMAEIFLAEAESIQGFPKQVALKRILPGLTSQKRFLDMFLDEARLSLRLQHSRIVQVFDIGRADEAYFIVMEFVDGVDLRTILNWRARLRNPAPVALALHIALEACAALGYAHELTHPETGHPLGIVHRDVTPANVLISKQGEVKVLDFGVAKATSQTLVTDPGVIKGKLAYLAPETAYGRKVDHRADLFAVGILLYEMLAAKRLFRGENDYETVQLIRAAKVPRLADQNEEVDAKLDAILKRTLSANPEHRYQSAADLADALAGYGSSRRLKVTPRDLARFVKRCIRDREDWTNQGLVPAEVDEKLKDEVDRFASIIYDPDSSELEALASQIAPQPPPPKLPPPLPSDTIEFNMAGLLPAPEELDDPGTSERTLLLERTPSRAISVAAVPAPEAPIPEAPMPATPTPEAPTAAHDRSRPPERLDPTLESIANLQREQRRAFWHLGVGLCLFCLITASIVALT